MPPNETFGAQGDGSADVMAGQDGAAGRLAPNCAQNMYPAALVKTDAAVRARMRMAGTEGCLLRGLFLRPRFGD